MKSGTTWMSRLFAGCVRPTRRSAAKTCSFPSGRRDWSRCRLRLWTRLGWARAPEAGVVVEHLGRRVVGGCGGRHVERARECAALEYEAAGARFGPAPLPHV